MASTKRKAATPAAATAPAKEPTVEEDIARLLDGLAQRGVHGIQIDVDMGSFRAAFQASTALQLLVAKGVCTQEEANAAAQATVKAMLAGLLQALEEAQLKAAKQIQVPQKPPIQLARLRD